MNNFGKILKELRAEKGISQAKLAEDTQITQSSIARWELNKTEPQLSEIKILAIYFNVTSDYLLGLEDEAGGKIKNTYYNSGIHIGNIDQR